MYEELVKRLRTQADAERYFSGEMMLCDEAADAIEELQADNFARKPQTNHDRIVSMKPEDLAIAICTVFGGIPWCKNFPECQDSRCLGCVVKWLKQEATE